MTDEFKITNISSRRRNDTDFEEVRGRCISTRENLARLLNICGFSARFNQLKMKRELYSGNVLLPSEDAVESELVGWANRYGLPEGIVKTHLKALCEEDSYHPLTEYMRGEWCGVERLGAVLDCFPVAPGRERYRDVVMHSVLCSMVIAGERGVISQKGVPVLFSEANDYCKTAAWERLFAFLPGSHSKAMTYDGRKKDCTIALMTHSSVCLDEVSATTKRSDSAELKMVIGLSEDYARLPWAAHATTKPRQCVMVATDNRRAFLDDPTLASRFWCIELTGPVDIERLNNVLGWDFSYNTASLAHPEKLHQFWMEVKHRLGVGEISEAPKGEDLEALRKEAKSNVEQSATEAYLMDVLAMHQADEVIQKPSLGNPRISQGYFTATDVAAEGPVKHANRIGVALSRLVADGVLEASRTRSARFYRFTDLAPATRLNTQ
jgi:hypothetical protein